MAAAVHVVPAFYKLDLSDKLTNPKPNLITRFLFVGKEPVRKGLAETVEAFLQVSKIRSDVELIIVSRDVPQRLIEMISKCPHIRLYNRLTPREECLRMMWESGVIVLPTHAETIGTVLVEAMARGCAAVTCDYEPMNEVVPDGTVGFTVPRGDTQALAEKMLVLARERDLLDQMQQNARCHYLETFSAEAVIPKLIGAYQEAINRYRQR